MESTRRKRKREELLFRSSQKGREGEMVDERSSPSQPFPFPRRHENEPEKVPKISPDSVAIFMD
jgi:hypothetical protein